MAKHWVNVILTAAALVLPAVPAMAQQPLSLSPGKAWKHKHSGISVPATLADTPRDGGTAYAADELDVGLSFVVGDAQESLTFYIFRNTNGGVPVWFAQAQWGIENRDVYGQPDLIDAPQPFIPQGQTSASGLKAVYETEGSAFRSTGVALLPVGEWYVKLRASSKTRSPQELAAWMDAAFAQVRWPGKIAAAPLAIPVTPCPTPLAFPVEAKDAPKDGGADLLAGFLNMMVAEKKAKKTPKSIAAESEARWCRDSALEGNAAAYRVNADTDRYLLALGDNGNGVWVGPDAGAALLGQTDSGKGDETRHSITLMMAAQNVNFVAQDRLPSPRRVFDIIEADRSVTTVPTWGKNKAINVNSSNF